jgi:hypothetical protein
MDYEDRSPARDDQGRPTRFQGKRKIAKPSAERGYGVPPPAHVLALVPKAADSPPDD